MYKKLLTQVGFGKEDNLPFIRFSEGDIIKKRQIGLGETINLKFQTEQRYCIGWFDPNTGENHTCPGREKIEAKYEQCQNCMFKTGFNPSFYHADSISANQEIYNNHPHILYLAYFSPEDIKIGISHAGRNLSRLLEQGARLAYILDTFPSANVARQYEASISKLEGIVENVKVNRKIDLISQPFDAEKALATLDNKKQQIEEQLKTKFSKAELIHTNNYFFAPGFDATRLSKVIDLSEQAQIGGRVVAIVGQIILCDYHDDIILLPLKRMIGYPFNEPEQELEIDLPSTQFSLF